ncbi:MAG: BBP7 family outer membrane beta-barrel protein, partial [Planctomycetota bacterium]
MRKPHTNPRISFLPRATLVVMMIACWCSSIFAQNDPSPIAPRDNETFPLWVRAEAIMWWVNDYNSPPLLVSNPVGTPDSDIGLLTDPSTEVLYGGSLSGGFRAGTRITAGMWLDECRCLGAQVEFFGLGRASNSFDSSRLNDVIISRPFTNTNPAVDGPDAQIIRLDGLTDGNFVGGTSNSLASWAPWLRWSLCRSRDCYQSEPEFCETCDSCTASGYDSCTMTGECNCDPDVPCDSYAGGRRVDLIGGYRFFKFRDDYRSVETLAPTGDFFAPGTTYELTDVIQTNTEFHGFEFGLSSARQVDRFVVELDTLLAVGRVTQRYTLDGRTTATIPNISTQSIPGG